MNTLTSEEMHYLNSHLKRFVLDTKYRPIRDVAGDIHSREALLGFCFSIANDFKKRYKAESKEGESLGPGYEK